MSKQVDVTRRVIYDIVILLIVGIPITIFYMDLEPFKRGYFCDDDSISYPYKSSTISDLELYTFGVFFPISLIIFTEILWFKRKENSATYLFCGQILHPMLWTIFCTCCVFLFGACVTELTADIFKNLAGRLRPHFLDVCQSDFNCSALTDQHTYVTDYTCTGADSHKIIDGRQSCPSGHAAFSTYTMLYAAIYIHRRMSLKRSILVKPILQYMLLLIALCTSLSRISDYKHHWSDVIIGFILGLSVCLTVVKFVPAQTEDTQNPVEISTDTLISIPTNQKNDGVWHVTNFE